MKPVRSILSVPGHKKSMHGKASLSKADVIMLDLEDAVPPEEKIPARKTIIRSLKGLDWQDKTLAVRINGLDTPFGFRDAIAIAEEAGHLIDFMVLPKVSCAGDIHFLDRLLWGIELETNLEKALGIEAAIETAQGMDQVSKIAKASPRLRSLSFGVADYTSSINAGLASVSGHGENETHMYPGHRWHYPLSRMVMAAKANSLFAVDAPYGNFKDINGLRESAALARALGCDGKWAIHPDQVQTINQVFSPGPDEIARAKTILSAAEKTGHSKGAIAVDGKMVDQATVRLAKSIQDQSRYLGSD